MIKLRKYFKGHTRMYIHGTVKGQEITFHGTLDKPEWVSEDIDLPNPVVLHRQEWYDIQTGEVLAVIFNLSEIDEDGTVRYSDWFNGCTIINYKDCMNDPPPGVETNPGPFFCLVVDDTEYWYDEIKEKFAWLQSQISNYNTELYLKEIDNG